MNTTPNQSNPYAPPSAKVQDAVDAMAAEPACRGARLGAVLLDGLIFACIVYLPMIFAIGSNLPQLIRNPNSFIDLIPTLGLAGLISLIGFIAFVILTINYVSRNGQSIGKKIIGIKVVRSDGTRATLG